MFDYITGAVSEIGQNSLIVDVSGIGFLVNTSLKTISDTSVGKQVRLYITEAIGETNFDLYGFTDKKERHFFDLLISISGVGPKAAISLLSSMNTDALIMAIINDDSKSLTSAPGIGKKIAQRIILELRDKMGTVVPDPVNSGSSGDLISSDQPAGSAVSDALAALAMLGYSTSEIGPIIRKGNWSGMEADQIIKAVLKNMI